jgi:hypothetical protein
MGYFYYYTPCYHGPLLDDDDLPTSDTVKQPGVNFGSGVEYTNNLPNGLRILKYDDVQTRCVIRILYTTTPLDGWEIKTSGEVLSDYPGLQGVE